MELCVVTGHFDVCNFKPQYIYKQRLLVKFSFRSDFVQITSNMSKLSLIVLSVFAVAFVAAQEPQVLKEYNNNDGSGTFEFSYEPKFFEEFLIE